MEARLELLERAVGEEIVGAEDEIRARTPEEPDEPAAGRRAGGRLEVFASYYPVDVPGELAERREGDRILQVGAVCRTTAARRHEARELAHHPVSADAQLEVDPRGGRPRPALTRTIGGCG